MANGPVTPHHRRVVGPRVECPNTRLPWDRCCGARDEAVGAAAGLAAAAATKPAPKAAASSAAAAR